MKVLITFLFGIIGLSESYAKVRNINMNIDSIAVIRTSLGVATIIQVPDRPSSVVIGNPGAFKIEYLDNGITVKPNFLGAKSNLYIFNDWRRFNLDLITVPQGQADYVVYLREGKSLHSKASKLPPKIEWKSIRKSMSVAPFSIYFEKGALIQQRLVLLEFSISCSQNSKVNPANFWIKQEGRIIPIHSLILEKLKCSKKSKVKGVIQALVSDLNMMKSFRIEFKNKKQEGFTSFSHFKVRRKV